MGDRKRDPFEKSCDKYRTNFRLIKNMNILFAVVTWPEAAQNIGTAFALGAVEFFWALSRS